MKKIKSFVTLWTTLLSFNILSAQTTLYNLGFTPDNTDSYQITAGSPTVVSSFDGLTDALLFHATTTYDQIELSIGTPAPKYQVDFDVTTHDLIGSMYEFTLFLDTPEVRTASLHGGLDALEVFQPNPFTSESLQSFADDTIYHLSFLIDLSSDTWGISVDGNPVYQNTFDATELDDIRISMSPWYLNAPDDPNAVAAIGNLQVEAIPEPSVSRIELSAVVIIFVSSKAFRREIKSPRPACMSAR
jgi:hypothetical protein